MVHVVGLDLSLTSTGVATIVTDDLRRPEYRGVERITSKGSKTATLIERSDRLNTIVGQVCVLAAGADLVVVEGPSFGQARQGGQHDRAGLWWLVVNALHANNLCVAEVPPATRARYATGKGNAPKDGVLAAVIRRYPDIDVTGNDEADALILAAMGARSQGCPIDDLPKAHVAAMDAVRWHDRVGAGAA